MAGRSHERTAVHYFASLDPALPKAWERVWHDGRDITTEPVETWPWPFSRRGELCGLRWLDVDLDAERIVVAQQVVQVGRQQLVTPPKTAAGEHRVVDLDADTVAILRDVQRRQDAERAEWGTAYQDNGLVFTWEDGRPFSPEDLTRRFPRLIKRFNDELRLRSLPSDSEEIKRIDPARINAIRTDPTLVGHPLPLVRFHDLRHLQASLVIAASVPLVLISKRLGHSSIQVTSDTYGHMLEGMGKQGAAAAAARAMIPRRSSSDT